MTTRSTAPLTPLTPLGLLTRPLPGWPAERALDWLARRIARRHPSLFERLPAAEATRLGLRPTDLPWQIVVEITADVATVRLFDAAVTPPDCAATVEGPLERLVACATGAGDGDAMFFARDIRVTGDTELVVAVRNALDDAEIDLVTEIAGLAGPFAGPARRLLGLADAFYHRLAAGLDQLRTEATAPLAARVDAQAREIARLQTEVHRLNRRAGRVGPERTP